jgi:hypothetical protein
MTRLVLAASLLALASAAALAQEGPTPTQALVQLDSKAPTNPTPADVTLKVDNRVTPITNLTRVVPAGAQVALLIDDGLRESVGRELGNLQAFVQHLPAGTEIFIGYMQNGRINPAQEFTTDYAAASKALRLPIGAFDMSASPYFCLSEFVKHWPEGSGSGAPKARFVLMITNGVDPYNGSDRISNQDSPYVSSAVVDAQRAGAAVYSIYFADAGRAMRGGAASFSGQGYLSQVAEGTGGTAYYQGTGNPVSMAPFLTQFQRAVAETFIATFNAPGGKDLVRIKLSTKLQGTKLHAPEEVRPGTLEGPTAQ